MTRPLTRDEWVREAALRLLESKAVADPLSASQVGKVIWDDCSKPAEAPKVEAKAVKK